MEGWEFDYSRIDRVLSFLKITQPVKLGFKTGYYKVGIHTSNYIHEIKISTYLEIEEANDTFGTNWLMLSRPKDYFERKDYPSETFYEEYSNAMGPPGSMYRNNQFEIEAREIAEKYGNLALLC